MTKPSVAATFLLLTCVVSGCSRQQNISRLFTQYDNAVSEIQSAAAKLGGTYQEGLQVHTWGQDQIDQVAHPRGLVIKYHRAAVASLLSIASERIDELDADGRRNGLLAIGFRGGGLLSSVAAAALVVASPANAVWVASFSGLSAFSAGIDASLQEEGFTRFAKVQVQANYTMSLTDAYKPLGIATAGLESSVGAEPKVWTEAYRKASSEREAFRATVSFPPPITLTAPQPDESGLERALRDKAIEFINGVEAPSTDGSG